MAVYENLYMFRSGKTPGLCGFSRSARGVGLPEGFAPWTGFGVVREDQKPPHGLPRAAIESGLDAKGFQLWRNKAKPEIKAAAKTKVKKK